MVRVQLPTQLSGLAAGKKFLEVEASNLAEVFRRIDDVAPMIRSQIFEPSGAIRQFVGVFLDERQIGELGKGEQLVNSDSQVAIVMAIAGG